jgi:DNA-binding NarL/FixJ family response regulator
MAEPIRVILADDHPVVRSGICAALRADQEITVLAEASTGDEAQRLCQQHHPHLLLLDLHMPGASVGQTISWLREYCPDTKVMLLTAHDDDASIRAVMRLGIAGYLLKEEAIDTLVKAVHAIHKGAAWYSQAIANRFVQWQLGLETEMDVHLTPRERDLLGLVARGWDNTAIAKALNLSEQTIRNYTSTLYEKLGVHSRGAAIVWARERGFAEEPLSLKPMN